MGSCHVRGPGLSSGNMSWPPLSPASTTVLGQETHLGDGGSSMEGMCFPQFWGQPPHAALCPFPWECKLWHTSKELKGSQRCPSTRKGSPFLNGGPWAPSWSLGHCGMRLMDCL